MRYLPLKPLLNWSPLLWDEENLPNFQANSGMNVYVDESETEVTVEASVPGLDQKDIKVTYQDGLLHIYGESSESEEEKRKGKVVKKWDMSTAVDYVTTLHRPIDSKSISAKIKNGIITIKAKIAEEAKPKEIEVKVG
ncbi:MAG: Hsp20/alpha crystallin family protein [Microgenomates group bacterium]